MIFTLLVVCFYLAVAMATFLILGLLMTVVVERSPYQRTFVEGRPPNPAPDGFHPGQPHVLFDKKTPWLGKSFDRKANLGFNLFTPLGARILKIASPLYQRFSMDQEGHTRAYYFKTYVGKGEKDGDTDVFKLDYDMPENPFWIRAILDEVVEISPGRYLGKIHVKVLPGVYVSVGYFGLKEGTVGDVAFGGSPTARELTN